MSIPVPSPLPASTLTAVVDVEWTSVRPVVPGQHVSRVSVSVPVDAGDPADAGRAEQDARLAAVQVVAARRGCVMATGALIRSVVL